SPKREGCHFSFGKRLDPASACEYHSGTPSWAVFGNSHGVELAYALADELSSIGDAVRHYTISGCKATYGRDTGSDYCDSWTGATVDYLVQDSAIQNVVFSYRN